jgi:hypothetical protein
LKTPKESHPKIRCPQLISSPNITNNIPEISSNDSIIFPRVLDETSSRLIFVIEIIRIITENKSRRAYNFSIAPSASLVVVSPNINK